MAAGVSVTSRSVRLLPPWLTWLGLVIAAAGGLSTANLVALPLTFAIPITRFGGFVWLIAAGVLMPRSVVRAERDRR